jgi:hypothetical protein
VWWISQLSKVPTMNSGMPIAIRVDAERDDGAPQVQRQLDCEPEREQPDPKPSSHGC